MLTAQDRDSLRELMLFKNLAPRELEAITSQLRRRTVSAGTNIMSAGQPGEVVYIISRGAVKIHLEQPDGTDVILAILSVGECLGEMDVIDTLGRSASADTLEETELLWIGRALFEEYLQTVPVLTYNLARILSRRLRLSNAQVQSLASLDAYGRVARQILTLADEYGVKSGGETDSPIIIPFRLTQSDLADMVGASRVRVNQILVLYKEKGYISIDPNYHIIVRDRQGLAERCT